MTDPWKVPIPPELAIDAEPIDQADLDSLLAALETAAADNACTATDALGPLLAGEAAAHHLAPEHARHWRPDGTGSAEWLSRKWRAAVDEITEAEDQAADWKRRIDEWAQHTTRRARSTRAWAEALLEFYAMTERERTGKATLTLPSATVATTLHKAKPVLAEGKESEFLGWAAEFMPELVRNDPKPAVSEFRHHLRVERVVSHYEWEATLECGHELAGVSAVAELPDGVVCPYCEPDPIEGQPVVAVASMNAEEVLRDAVMATIEDPDPSFLGPPVDVEPPGLRVEPANVTAKVKA